MTTPALSPSAKRLLRVFKKVLPLMEHAETIQGPPQRVALGMLKDRAVECAQAFSTTKIHESEAFGLVFFAWFRNHSYSTQNYLAIRFGLFSGIAFNVGEASLLLGRPCRKLQALEEHLAEEFPSRWAEAGRRVKAYEMHGDLSVSAEDC